MAALAALTAGAGVLGADVAGTAGIPIWVYMAGAMLGSTGMVMLVIRFMDRREHTATAKKNETENVEIEDRIRRALIEETEQRFSELRSDNGKLRERVASLEMLLEERRTQYQRALRERDDVLQEFRRKVLEQDKHIQALSARVLGDREPSRHDDIDVPADGPPDAVK